LDICGRNIDIYILISIRC